MDSLKQALGPTFDPEGDYLVCGYDNLHFCQSRGYRQVGEIQDPTTVDSTLLVFLRPKPAPLPKAPEPPLVVAPDPPTKKRLFK